MLGSAFRSLDLFQFKGIPQHVAGSQKSRFGFVGTLVLAAVMLFYAIFTFYTFFTEPPSTSVTQSPTSNENHTMVETCIRIPHISNKSYFGYTFQRVHNDINQSATEKIDLNIKENGEDEICLPAKSHNGYLNNFCKIGNECDYLKFKLYLCGSNDYKNPAHYNDTSKCMPFPELVRILQTNYVTFEYKTHLGGVLWNMPAKTNTSLQLFTLFQLNETRSAPDLLRWWSERQYFNLQHDRDTFAIQYYFGAEYPDKEVLELQIILAAESLLTVESRKTSLDVVGSIGALWGVVFGALATVFMGYNERKFFEKNPAWSKIDQNFQVEKGAEAEINEESKMLIEQNKQNSNFMAYGNLS